MSKDVPDRQIHVHVHITGIVQGVGYRPFVWKLAHARNLTGWVRNAADGVHVDVTGPQPAVDQFVLLLSTQAPDAARVDTVHVDRLPLESVPDGSGVGAGGATAAADNPDGAVDGLEDGGGFRIIFSDSATQRSTLVSPDIATCPACLAELMDKNNRRYHYPFINCTNCGPRFTIIDDLPYDRAKTTMAPFVMCGPCQEEYTNPLDRRFHAQPNACFDCGPQLFWRTVEDPGKVLWGSSRQESDALISAAATMIIRGGIVAVKGLGGYHLVCDATNQQSVQKLRERKQRRTKPLAIMLNSLENIRKICHVDTTERSLLTGAVRPIVLLRRRAEEELEGLEERLRICDAVAGPLPQLGVMLPYTPVQHLLMEAVGGRPLVMTSGNISEEPIIADDQLAVARLIDVADAFLGNNRPIHARYDDSVFMVVDGSPMVVRRARGTAPTPLALPPCSAGGVEVLATGPEQKATFCITRGEQAFVSQHIGDLENAEAFDSWLQSLQQYKKLFDLPWNALACDMHPGYLSSKWARDHADTEAVPLTEVQHHHAHIASVLAELDIRQRVVGIALDGTGYGPDGTVWGGEILTCSLTDYTRAAHLRSFRLPGGAAAIRKPLRTALGLLDSLGMAETEAAQKLVERMGVEGPVARQMLLRGLNSPQTSSAGRLFDAVAALLGLCEEAGYEGEPACLLEAAASLVESADTDAGAASRYRLELVPGQADGAADAAAAADPASEPAADGSTDGTDAAAGDVPEPDAEPDAVPDADAPQDGSPQTAVTPFVIDTAPLIHAVLEDMAAQVDVRVIARRFHNAFNAGVAHAAVAVARTGGYTGVAMSGGVFMNRLVLSGVQTHLRSAGLDVYIPHGLPVNDGCISYGQAAVARARIAARLAQNG